MSALSFRAWLRVCDSLIYDAIGVSLHDLIDCTWRDWYDDGLSPSEATEDIRNDPYSYI
jgi:hypothetical protein